MDTLPHAPRIAVLGPVLVEDRSGALAEPAGALGKGLIVALVLARGTLSVQSLVSDLWHDTPPRQERAALQTLVSRVRTASADGILESTPSGYALAIDPRLTDLGLARMHLERAREADAAADPEQAAAEAGLGLDLWRGEPGVELGPSPLADELGRTAATLRDELTVLRARSRRLLGDPAGALHDLESLLIASPLDETLHLERLRALDDAGRRNDALRAFGELKAAMLDQLGSRPGPALVAFNASLLVDDESATAAPVTTRYGLRTTPNALIGREYDLDALEDLIATSRLTTVLGAGGLGKTRLAQELAHRAQHTPVVAFVELASVRSADDITLAFASTLGIREARAVRLGDPGAGLDLRSRILALLAERETLLIVDNCEHIVDAAATWIADILESTTTVRVLATSRSPLAIGAERVYALDSLASGTSAGDEAGPAVALFEERARAGRPAVVLPPEVVARLCDRLDGLPLAIELAAARTRSMSVEEIERRLENRFVLLTGGERTAPERHRTLLAVIEWSWNLLGETEQTLLRRLSCFPDGFSAQAAEAVAGDSAATVLDDLEALVNQSLVTVSEDKTTGILRYRMLETVREFGAIALDEAGEHDVVQEGMNRWGVRFCRETLALMHGPTQVHNFNLVTAEQDNLVAVLRAAIERRHHRVIAATFSALAYYWSLRSAHSEVVAFGAVVMEALTGWEPEDDDIDDAAAVYGVIGGTFLYADMRTGVRAISRLRRIKRLRPLRDPRLESITDLVQTAGREREGMAMIARFQRSTDTDVAALGNLIMAQFQENAGDLEGALHSAGTAYEKSLLAEDTWSTASAAQSIAQIHSQLAHPESAIEWAQRAREGLTKLQALGDLRQLDWIVAINSISAGDLTAGRDLLERYLQDDVAPSGFEYVDYFGIGHAGLAEIALAEGNLAEGLGHYRDAIGLYESNSALTNPWLTILSAASLAAHLRVEAEGSSPVDTAQIDAAARLLRTRILVNHRLQAAYVDKPVLGSGLLGVSAWMLTPRVAEARAGGEGQRDEWVRSGLELYAIADRVNARQDQRSLNRARLAEEIRGAWGETVLDEPFAAVADLDRNTGALRALDLLHSLRF
ncbi:AfsR/SARP family transcriptional regulator [Leifsonia poae]|uniref:AfsR/SARP family transcriptional regulator n=1 Tax=Leifsonia poae TaxID=110933 RepID=UPI001CC04D39|nr:BTAD domain-containing putative transcriptional regulator [Leifsonia poae]